MFFWNLDSLKLEEFRPGIKSKAEIGDNLIMVCMEIGPRREDIGHEHSFDQFGVVLHGQIEVFIGDNRQILNPNESHFIPAGKNHGWKTFGDGTTTTTMELLPLKYKFRVSYGGASQDKYQHVGNEIK